MSLTVEELREKIEYIKKDITRLQVENGSDKKISMMYDYIDFVKEEIKMLDEQNRKNNG